MKRLQLLLILAMAVILCGTAHATQYSFTDQHIYWPGWTSKDTSDNTRDAIGNPQLTGGYITVQNGHLTSVAIQGSGYSMSRGGTIPFGDLFLDVNSDNVWDYVVRLGGSSGKGYRSIYHLSLGLNSTTGYIMTDPGYWSGYDIRNDHPWELDTRFGTKLDPKAYFSGITSDGTLIFSLPGSLMEVGSTVTIGWTVGCANDVIYEQVRVPEPSIALLLGFGLAGLAFRKKLRKAS